MIGKILSGSFTDGFLCLLESSSGKALQVGSYCTVSLISDQKVFCLVTNIFVDTKDVFDFIKLAQPPDSRFGQLFRKHNSFMQANLYPLLVLDGEKKLKSFVQMPASLSPVSVATNQDFQQIFGLEVLDGSQPLLCVGNPIGKDAQVCLDLRKFVERSNGIFGKTGTGKTFLSRILLSGLIRSGVCVNLIFDMHGEYGLSARSEESEQFVLGLKSLFGNKVMLCSLDPDSTRQRGCNPDCEVIFDLAEITVEDVITLQTELSLHPTAVEVAYLLYASFGKTWLYKLFEKDLVLKDLASQIGAHTESLSALFRKLKRLESLPFIKKDLPSSHQSVVNILLENLERGVNIVLEFGRQTSNLTYLLVSGILTRQIHKRYIKKTEEFLASKKSSLQPKPLVITIEEAHNFLNTGLAKQTIFGKIAREMRKYFVTLLVIDQRPSGICDEIISQLGTKLVAKLEDEKDLSVVFQGASGGVQLKNLCSRLEPKGQALIFGYALALPIIIATRKYDNTFYEKIKLTKLSDQSLGETIESIFG